MMFYDMNQQGIGKYINLERFGLSTFALKVLAVLTMVCDHVGALFFQSSGMEYQMLRGIGRLSFPIFCFVLVEGFFYTGNRLEHAIRLGVFALLSEIPYDAAFGEGRWDLEHQNVLFTLFFGFLMIWGLDSISKYWVNYPERLLRVMGASRLNVILELVAIAAGLGAAYLLKSSYSYAGVMLILCFYAFHKHHIGRFLSNLVFNMGMFGFGLQWWGAVSTIPIAFYNGKPGRKSGKYFFYCFYPLHLVVLVLVRKFLF